MKWVLWDEPDAALSLRPFTFTRPISKIRVGIFTLAERLGRLLGAQDNVSYWTEDTLKKELFPLDLSVNDEDVLLVKSSLLLTRALFEELKNLKIGEQLMGKDRFLAARTHGKQAVEKTWHTLPQRQSRQAILALEKPWHIVEFNAQQIREDMQWFFPKHTGEVFLTPPPDHCHIISDMENPVFIGNSVSIGPGAVIEGPCVVGDECVVRSHSHLRAGSTLGPNCKVGGEIAKSIFFGYSNKAHEGFVGHSVVGEWCNLGAGTTTSNMKNNYSTVRLWDAKTQDFKDTGTSFCGSMIGDHVNCGIGTKLPTGCVIDPISQVFLSTFVPKHVPMFSWLEDGKQEMFRPNEAISVAERMMRRRNQTLKPERKRLMKHLYETAKACHPSLRS